MSTEGRGTILEFGIFALMVLSLIRGEFLFHKPKTLLLVALAAAFFT